MIQKAIDCGAFTMPGMTPLHSVLSTPVFEVMWYFGVQNGMN